MKLSDIMSAAGLTIYPRIALVLFLFAFTIVVVRLLWPGRQAQWAREAALPLEDVNDRFATDRFATDRLATDRSPAGRSPADRSTDGRHAAPHAED